jgi:hypothetical protein
MKPSLPACALVVPRQQKAYVTATAFRFVLPYKNNNYPVGAVDPKNFDADLDPKISPGDILEVKFSFLSTR